jgi:hypothetical protein
MRSIPGAIGSKGALSSVGESASNFERGSASNARIASMKEKGFQVHISGRVESGQVRMQGLFLAAVLRG